MYTLNDFKNNIVYMYTMENGKWLLAGMGFGVSVVAAYKIVMYHKNTNKSEEEGICKIE